jgi:hypothetical protein
LVKDFLTGFWGRTRLNFEEVPWQECGAKAKLSELAAAVVRRRTTERMAIQESASSRRRLESVMEHYVCGLVRGPDGMDSPILGFADIFVSTKTISKRELVRNPSLASHLKPGQSLQLEDGKEPLVLSRRKRARLTAEQIHAKLDRLCEGAPEQDAQAALRHLRR